MCFDHPASFPQSLHSNSPLDISIKGQMIRDLLNLAGFVLPNAEDIVSSSSSSSSSTTRSASLLFRSRLAACTAPSCPSEGMVAGHSPAWSPLLRHLPYGLFMRYCCVSVPTGTFGSTAPLLRNLHRACGISVPLNVDVQGPSLLFPDAGPFTPLLVSVL